MPSAELATFLSMNEDVDEIDLLEIPGQRYDSDLVQVRDTLQVALEKMDDKHLDVLYVGHQPVSASDKIRIEGIVTRHMVETAYRYR